MITFSKFKESSFYQGGKRLLKVIQFGAKTAKESMPFGYDGNPIPELTAIYAATSNASEKVIIGYINKNQLAATGEVRLYSLDANGAVSAFMWLHNDGNLELNGDDYTAVRYSMLNTGLQQEVLKINAELTKIAAAITVAGGSYVPEFITLDISGAESPTVKLK